MKLTKLISGIIAITILLCSCVKSPEESSVVESSSESETTITTTTTIETQSYNEQDEFDKMANDFLISLKNCYHNYFISSTGFWDYPYSSLQGTKVDNYTIAFDKELYNLDPDNHKYTYGCSYKVDLDISESYCKQFPVGKSHWILEIAPGEGGSATFYPEGTTLTRIWYDKDKILPATELCYRFSTLFHCYETIDDFNKLVPSTTNIEAFNDFCIKASRFSGTNIEKIQENLKKILRINNIDFTKCSIYDEEQNQLHEQTGGFWTYPNITSQEYNKETKKYTITIEYYADSTYIFVAKTMQYIVTENDDGSFRIKSTELLFDSYYNPAHGSI